MYENSTINFNSYLLDASSNLFDPTTTSSYNFVMGLDMAHLNPAVFVTLTQSVCSNAGSGNNSFTNNLVNQSTLLSASCGTANTIAPAVPEVLGWFSNVDAPLDLAARYHLAMPNYPATVNTGSGGCGTTRAALITCMAPAIGQIITGSLSTSCVLTTAASLPAGTHINGPGFPDPATGNVRDNHVTTAGGVGPYQIASTACTLETSQTYGTGLENNDGTYNGALFPADDFGVISWNDGSVFDHTAHHAAAQ